LYRLKTEDGVEVKKIYIKLLDPAIGYDEIMFLLSVYGTIDDIKIFGKSRKSGWKMRNRGFVTFEKSCDASCALINRKKFSEFFLLSAADTEFQPDYECLKKEFECGEICDQSESTLLSHLNDDCLLHVLSFLDFTDILSLKKVCVKFLELSEIHFKTVKSLAFSHIKSKKKMTLHEAKLVMKTIGHNVKKASINSEKFYNRRVLNFVPKYLINVKHLHLTGFKLESPAFWDQMSKILVNLETLDLSDNSDVNENFLKSFKKTSPKLKVLNVSNSNVNGNFLHLLPMIESLNISGCRFVNGKQLCDFVDKNKNLKSLNVSKCPNLDGKDLNEILKKIPKCEALFLNNYYIDDVTSRFVIPSINPLVTLKELTICNINFPPCDQLLRTINLENSIEVLNVSYGNLTLTSVYAISTMAHLKKLIMNFKNAVPEDLVDYLMELEQLEEIHMSCCSYLSPANVLRLISLPKLSFMDISRCYGFTNEFIIEAVHRLKERKLKKCFTIHVGQTEIDQNVFDEPELTECLGIININWESTKDVEHDYDIDEENNRTETVNQQEYFTLDDIINILSNIDDCDPKLVETIKKNL
jgi:F-box domain